MNQKNVEYQNGMFILSDTDDVQQLMYNLRGRRVADYNDTEVMAAEAINNEYTLRDIIMQLQVIEKRQKEQIDNSDKLEFEVIKDSLVRILEEHYGEAKQELQTLYTILLAVFEERDALISQEISALRDELAAYRKVVESQCGKWQDYVTHERRMIEEIHKNIEEKKAEEQQSWWSKIFEIHPKE